MTDEAKRCVEALRWSHLHNDCTEKAYNCPVVYECVRAGRNLCDPIVAADLIESLAAELEQVKRERDAAVKDLYDYGMLCVLCLHENKAVDEEPCKSCSHASTVNRHTNWQWRGVKEEEENERISF